MCLVNELMQLVIKTFCIFFFLMLNNILMAAVADAVVFRVKTIDKKWNNVKHTCVQTIGLKMMKSREYFKPLHTHTHAPCPSLSFKCMHSHCYYSEIRARDAINTWACAGRHRHQLYCVFFLPIGSDIQYLITKWNRVDNCKTKI